jgi:FtsP/CotA-like multicopper oxidase with cupredoxin domain
MRNNPSLADGYHVHMLSRRELMQMSGAVAVCAGLPRPAQPESAPDFKLDIATTTLEPSPRTRIRTSTYNSMAPGPLLRFKEGHPVTIEVANHTDHPEVVHWHGLYLPIAVDGAIEEGTPAIAPGATARYTFTPTPSGFRWYHTHTVAMGDLNRGQYTGLHGPLLIEPREDPGRYDREFFLMLHDWQGRLSASDDGAMNPAYGLSTINGRVLGYGEPLRVREGERVLLHVLNTSPTEPHWIALAGHELRVVALDGNIVATPRDVPMLRLAPGERVCAVVEMSHPGIWILGEVRKHVQAAGMGIVVEYAGQGGAPRWNQPADLIWNYWQFAAAGLPVPPDPPATRVPLVFESKFRGHGAMEAWTINGESYPETRAASLRQGERYRLQFINRSRDDHPVHRHRHSFELRDLGIPLDGHREAVARGLRGIIKDVVIVEAQTQSEVEFTADHPGATLFHCHQQNHMDLGFMLLFTYA